MKKKTILTILTSVLLAGAVGIAGVVGFSNRMSDEEKTELAHSIISQLPSGVEAGIYVGYSEATEEVLISMDSVINDVDLITNNEAIYNAYEVSKDEFISINDNIKDIFDERGAGFVEVVSVLYTNDTDDGILLQIRDGKVEYDAVEEAR